MTQNLLGARYAVFLLISLVALIALPTSADAQQLLLRSQDRVERTGGEIAGFMGLVYFKMTPEVPDAGEEVRVDMIIDHLIERDSVGKVINSDSIINIQVFGDWFPSNELASLVRDRSRNLFLGRQNYSFTFRAPTTAGTHKVRILFSDAGSQMTSFYGGSITNPNASARMWIELEIRLTQPADAAEFDRVPTREYRFQPEAMSFVRAGTDYCDAARYVDPVAGGRIPDVAEFVGYELLPRRIYTGDEVILSLKLRHDPRNPRGKRHLAVFGSWRPEIPVARPINGAVTAELPAEDIITVRFPAPREPRDYRVRVLLSLGDAAPKSFFGGLDATGKEQASPDLWTEIPVRVAPRLNMFNVAREAARLLIFDEMPAEKQVSQFGGGIEEFLTVDGIDISPENPSVGESVHVKVTLSRARSAGSAPIYARLFGSWNDGAPLGNGIAGATANSLQQKTIIEADFPAPKEGGLQHIRLAVANSDAVHDFFGKGVTRAYRDIVFWAEASFPVKGGQAEDEAEDEKLLASYIAQGIPVLEHQPVLMAAEGIDLRLFTTVVCPRDVSNVSLYYRHDGDDNFVEIPAEPIEERVENRRTYGVRLTGGDQVFPTGFQYYFAVSEAASPGTQSRTITLPFRDPQANPLKTLVDKDVEPPTITPLLPEAGSLIVAPQVVVKFHIFEDPSGIISGVDPNSIVMMLDTQTVFPEPEVLESRFGVPARLIFSLRKAGVEIRNGEHRVSIFCKDYAGNAAETVTWTFKYKNSVAAVGDWQFGGNTQTRYSHYDYREKTDGEGSTGENDQTLNVTRRLPNNWMLRSSGSFRQTHPGLLPRSTRPTTREEMTAGYLTLENSGNFLTFGGGNAGLPSNLTGNSSVNWLTGGLTGRYGWNRYELRALYEPKDPQGTTTSGLTSANVDRTRGGYALRMNLTPDASNWASWSSLFTREQSINNSIGVTPDGSGRIGLLQLGLMPLPERFKSLLQAQLDIGTSRENSLERNAYKIALSGRGAMFTWNYEEGFGQTDFGKMSGSSFRTDYAGRSGGINLNLLQNQLALSLSGGRDHDNILRQKIETLWNDNLSATARFNRSNWPSFSYSFGANAGRTDLKPYTTDYDKRTHQVQTSYTRSAWTFGGDWTQAISEDHVGTSSSRSTTMNYSLRYTPIPQLQISGGWHPSTTLDMGKLNTTYSDRRDFSISYRFWDNKADLSLRHDLTHSYDSLRTASTWTKTLGGGLNIRPGWKAWRFVPYVNLDFNTTEQENRMLNTSTRIATFNASVNTSF